MPFPGLDSPLRPDRAGAWRTPFTPHDEAPPAPILTPGSFGEPVPIPDRSESVPAVEALIGRMPATASLPERWLELEAYLRANENGDESIARLRHLLPAAQVLLEIGCGDAQVGLQIAVKNPEMAVIATDAYEWEGQEGGASRYRRVALAWRARRLAAQQLAPSNLAVLRAQIDILGFMPAASVDHLLLIHPEPQVARVILDRLAAPDFYRVLKPGARQIVVLPYCREMGVCACGGFEFEHGADWSRGLGALMDSKFGFERAERIHWGVDLSKASLYTGNSTQTDVFVTGAMRPRPR